MIFLQNKKGEKMYRALGKIGIQENESMREDDYYVYEITIQAEYYSYDVIIEVMERESHSNFCRDLGVLSVEVVKSHGYSLDKGLMDRDLKDMLVAIDDCEKLLLKEGIPFEKSYRFCKHNRKRTAKNLANRLNWNIEECLKEWGK